MNKKKKKIKSVVANSPFAFAVRLFSVRMRTKARRRKSEIQYTLERYLRIGELYEILY